MSSTTGPRDGFALGLRTLLGATGCALAAGLLATVLGAVLEGSAAAAGAAVGTVLAVGVFSFGVYVVNAVARVMPQATVFVALLTYTLQVLAMALAFVALRSSGALESDVDPRWLGGTVIAATLAWLAAHVALALRQRIPVYDLPARDLDGDPEGARDTAPDTGDR